MKDQARRDEQTLAIATALAVAVATFAIAVVAIAVLGDVSHDFDAAFPWMTGVAFAAGLGYLIVRRS